MRDALTVLRYTFYENARRKVFIISTVIILILTILIVSIPGIIHLVNDKKNNNNSASKTNVTQTVNNRENVYIVDENKLLNKYLPELRKEYSEYNFILKPSTEIKAIKKRIKKHSEVLVIATSNGKVPALKFFVKRYGEGIAPDSLSKTIKSLLNQELLKASGVSKATSGMILQDISYSISTTGKGSFNNTLVAMLIIMILFFAIYFYGYGVAMSVSSEKTSRVMEILLTSTDPSSIILGKSAAMGLLGLCQLISIIIAGTLTYKLTFPKNFTISGQKLDFSIFNPSILIFIIVFFLLGYTLYAMINAVAGASVSKSEDVNSAMMPCSLIMFAAYYVSNIALNAPDGNLSIVASIIPFSSPFTMPCRILMSEVPASQLLLSICVLIATIILVTLISIRLYSSAVLHYGNRLKLKDLIKISRQ